MGGGDSHYRRTVIITHQKYFNFRRVEMTSNGLVHARYSLLKWQAVKLTFFAPCYREINNSKPKQEQHIILFLVLITL